MIHVPLIHDIVHVCILEVKTLVLWVYINTCECHVQRKSGPMINEPTCACKSCEQAMADSCFSRRVCVCPYVIYWKCVDCVLLTLLLCILMRPQACTSLKPQPTR